VAAKGRRAGESHRLEALLATGLAALALYAAAAFLTFQIRHPWLTQTEVALHAATALTWGTVEKGDR